MSLNFTAIDFETANSQRASVCAVGAARVRDGRVVESWSTLVRPPDGVHEFDGMNISIHGIRPLDVVDAPTWPEAYRRLASFIGDDVFVAHNAAFDMSVLLNACGVCDIDWPNYSSLCTMRLAREVLTLPSYSLPWVASALDIEERDHHDPEEDALWAAEVRIALASRIGAADISDISQKSGLAVRPTWVGQDRETETVAVSAPDLAPGSTSNEGFLGEIVCFTGGLKSMARDDAHALVIESGGSWSAGVTKKTTVLVTGDFDSRTFRPGAALTSKLERAMELSASGLAIEILTEDQFVLRLLLRDEQVAERLASARAQKGGKLPAYVVDSVVSYIDGEDGWAWFRRALANPSGRALGGEKCVWCGQEVRATSHWTYRDRHVCSGRCNENFKRSAKRAWRAAGVALPEMN